MATDSSIAKHLKCGKTKATDVTKTLLRTNQWQSDKRRSFVIELARQLVTPHMTIRATDLLVFRFVHIKQAMSLFIIVVSMLNINMKQSSVYWFDYKLFLGTGLSAIHITCSSITTASNTSFASTSESSIRTSRQRLCRTGPRRHNRKPNPNCDINIKPDGTTNNCWLPITLKQFIRMWRTLILKRVQDVIEKQLLARPDHFVRLSRNIMLPAPCADLLYSLRQFHSNANGLIYNISQPARADPPQIGG